MNPQVLCLDGLASDYDSEGRCSDVDGEEGVFQDQKLQKSGWIGLSYTW